MILLDVPVDPTADDARRLVLEELAKAEYRAAQPNWLDQLATGFYKWLASLTFSGSDGPPWSLFAAVLVVIALGMGIAFLVFGAPRRGRRSTVTGSLFGRQDERDAAAMRADAAAAAREGDYTLAIAELFRAIARSLAERTVVTVDPGTTARDFAARAARGFPSSASELASAAAAFDAVRYLEHDGTREQYEAIVALDRALDASRPVLEPVGA